MSHYIAQEIGITINRLLIALETSLDPDKFSGKSMEPRAGYQSISVTFKIDADASPEQLDPFLAIIKNRCPVSDNVACIHFFIKDKQIIKRNFTESPQSFPKVFLGFIHGDQNSDSIDHSLKVLGLVDVFHFNAGVQPEDSVPVSQSYSELYLITHFCPLNLAHMQAQFRSGQTK